MVATSSFDFDDGTKTSDVKAGVTGDAAIKLYQKTGNSKAKFNLITVNPERLKLFYNALTYTAGVLSGNTQAAKELRPGVWTFVPKQVLADNTEFGDTNISPDAIQMPRGIATNGFGFKSSPDKEYNYDVEVMGLPDLDQPGYPSWRRGAGIVLPAASGLFVDTIVKGVGYTAIPTAIAATGLTGFAATSQINADGSLNIIITNPGTAAANLVGTWINLTITGGTSTTAQTARVYIG
jgi:hypothetical protein